MRDASLLGDAFYYRENDYSPSASSAMPAGLYARARYPAAHSPRLLICAGGAPLRVYHLKPAPPE